MSRYVPVVAPLSRKDIEQHAREVIERHHPDLLKKPGKFPVLDFFDHTLVDEYGLDSGVEGLSDGVEGITWPDGRVLISEATYIDASNGAGRGRFTVMHECYHGIQHRNQIHEALIDVGELVLYRRADIKAYLDPEWQANMFAGAVLMPEDMIRELALTESRWSLPGAMVEAFGVSLQAAEVRLKKIGM